MHETALLLALLNANGVERLPSAKTVAHASVAARKAKPHVLRRTVQTGNHGQCPPGTTQRKVGKNEERCVANSTSSSSGSSSTSSSHHKTKLPAGAQAAKHKVVKKAY
jgi:hypothetical protein